MLKILFLCSGGGGNLRFVLQAIRLGLLEDAQICAVITDRDCPASDFAIQNSMPSLKFDFSEKSHPSLLKALSDFAPNLIVTNVHKILPFSVVDAYRGKLLNLHYSLLPAFGGLIGAKPIRQALEYGAQLVGVTVHLVSEEVDAGSPVVQAAIPVTSGESEADLMDVVFRTGCISLLQGISLASGINLGQSADYSSTLSVSGRTVLFNPQVTSAPVFQEESFWQSLK